MGAAERAMRTRNRKPDPDLGPEGKPSSAEEKAADLRGHRRGVLSTRKYPEHLYFAIHLHAFIFLALATVGLLKFSRLAPLVAIGGTIALIWIPTYATVAFRRTYGGSFGGTVLKEIGIGAIYLTVSFVAFLLTAYWVSLYA
jgi:hypothetical protein